MGDPSYGLLGQRGIARVEGSAAQVEHTEQVDSDHTNQCQTGSEKPPAPLLFIPLLIGSRKSPFADKSENLTRFSDLGETIASLLRKRFERIHIPEGQCRKFLL